MLITEEPALHLPEVSLATAGGVGGAWVRFGAVRQYGRQRCNEGRV